MTLRITTEAITSDLTAHRAERVSAAADLWRVSWLPPDDVVDRNRAITAVTLAETFATCPNPNPQMWAVLAGWAGELGLTVDEARALVSRGGDSR